MTDKGEIKIRRSNFI